MKFSIYIFLVFLVAEVYGQHGYLGKKNIFSGSITFLINENINLSKEKPINNFLYQFAPSLAPGITFERILTPKVSVNLLGYYQNYKLYVGSNPNPFFSENKKQINIHSPSLSIQIKKYINFYAPTGSYVGLGLGGGPIISTPFTIFNTVEGQAGVVQIGRVVSPTIFLLISYGKRRILKDKIALDYALDLRVSGALMSNLFSNNEYTIGELIFDENNNSIEYFKSSINGTIARNQILSFKVCFGLLK